MINLLQMQDKLKDMSDRQLASEMQSGMVPQYLVLSELQRRQKMRQTAKLSQQGQQPQTTVADEIESEFAPNEGVAALPIEEPQFASGGIVSFAGGGKVYNPGDVVYFKGAPYTVDENGKVMYGGMRTDPSLLDQSERIRQRDEYSANNGLYNRDRPVFTPQQGSTPPGVQTDSSGRFVNAQGQNIADLIPKDKVVNGKVVPADLPAPASAPAQEQAKPKLPADDKTTPKEPPVSGDKPTPAGMGWTSIYPTLNEGVGAYPTLKTEAQDKAAEELLAKYEKNKAGAADQAMIAAGLAMMAGKSPYALQNIGAGGIEGLKAYKQEQKDLEEMHKGILGIGTKKEEAENLRNQAEYKAKAEERLLKAGLYRGEQKILSDEYIAELHRRAQTDQYARQELKERNDFLQSSIASIERTLQTNPMMTEAEKSSLLRERAMLRRQANQINPGTFPEESMQSSGGRAVMGSDNVVRRAK